MDRTSGLVTTGQVAALPWYREVTRDQWRAFAAVFLGWIVDSFDFNVLTFILIDIQRSFTVDRALAGMLGTVTLAMRLVGGTLAGTASDKWGRKLPLLFSVLWFSIFAFLAGFSTSYAMLFGLRALSDSGWAENGLRECRWFSSIGRRNCAAWLQACCSAGGTGDICSRRPRFNSSIRYFRGIPTLAGE
jgi:MFS family permease